MSLSSSRSRRQTPTRPAPRVSTSPAAVQEKFAPQSSHVAFRKPDFVGLGRMLDSRGHVDGVTPQIVSKQAAADHARDCRAGMISNPEFERRAREGFSLHGLPEIKRVSGRASRRGWKEWDKGSQRPPLRSRRSS